MAIKQVRFVKHTSYGAYYNAGEVAGFEEPQAAELVKAGHAVYARRPASVEELEAQVAAAGYSADAAKKIARQRFDGNYGEDSRYLPPNAVDHTPAAADEVEREIAFERGEEAAGDQPPALSQDEVDEAVEEQLGEIGADEGVVVVPEGASEEQVEIALEAAGAEPPPPRRGRKGK